MLVELKTNHVILCNSLCSHRFPLT